MSYKRQLQAHYQNFIDAVTTMTVPEWVTGRAVRSALFLSVMFLSVAYMVRINSAATSGYEIHSLEKQVSEVTVQVQDLEIKIADAGAMYNIEKRLPELSMVMAGPVQRINPGSVVAIAR